MMVIEIETAQYNDRRYGRPWIAVVRVSREAPSGVYNWGDWIGQAGCEGRLTMEADPGDIIAQGRKDFRNARKGHACYSMLLADGSLEEHTSLAAAIMAQRVFLAAAAGSPCVVAAPTMAAHTGAV